MNKMIILISLAVTVVLVNLGVSMNSQIEQDNNDYALLQDKINGMQQAIKDKELLPRQPPVELHVAYNAVLNETRLLESTSGTNMNIQLEGAMEVPDISTHYEKTAYRGVRGLKIRIVIDKFSRETDMGAVLDDIHTLEANTDFLASEISKDNNNLIIKGEIYGL
ncbi:MAG: hypothetical protein KGJ09_03655 [Candidatus Omnitrophica bacterium]|nr:hypothetical protein [Candidatus Omnitrophota bacterium]MDE2009155.1 hypothetical protein [Candidatus Omnitrophota bacterium]MDE2213676.1 hypothetical protein [Candidatus Omnitrophota bacterium]MDE2230749.1 hypothetical protein [Candidatus Omnitrophota bacterium]